MIDLTKLKNVVKKDGKTVAQCPACAAVGADTKGDHLAIFEDGKFACVANPGDKTHNKEIHKLVGKGGTASSAPPTLQIKRQLIPESSIVMKIGRLGRRKPTSAETTSSEAAATEQPEGSTEKESNAAQGTPEPPAESKGWGHGPGGATMEEVWEFLGKK
jgi:hypothetical protein